jgi:putative ABC transport system permease protein
VFNYYVSLTLRSWDRKLFVTALMISSIGVGIGVSMTMLTIFLAMARDPIPEQSAHLFVPQIDNWGPGIHAGKGGDRLQPQISYTDAMNWMNDRAAPRQTAMYATSLALTPSDPKLHPSVVEVRAAYRDFFPMFGVPFQYGSTWSETDDAGSASVAVITRELNDKVFGGTNSVGETLILNDHIYHVVGVMDRWGPIPRVYDMTVNKYGKTEDVFLPFTRAIDAHMDSVGNFNCRGEVGDGWDGRLRSECIWIQFWVQLPTVADEARYRSFLIDYASNQKRLGRFHWPPHTQLLDVRHWLDNQHAVSDEARILVLLSFSVLVVCLLGAMGLMLWKIMGKAAEFGVRTALGARRSDVFAQCAIEVGLVGLAGGFLGVALAALGLTEVHALMSDEIRALTFLNKSDIGIAAALAAVSTVVVGSYPMWRAARLRVPASTSEAP